MIKNRKFDWHIWLNVIGICISWLLTLIALIYNICMIQSIFLSFTLGITNGILLALCINSIFEKIREQRLYIIAREETNKFLQWKLLHPDLYINCYMENIINKDKGEIE